MLTESLLTFYSIINKNCLGSMEIKKVKKTKKKIYSYNNEINTLGKIHLVVEKDNSKFLHCFFIVREGRNPMGIDLIKKLENGV